MCTSFRFLWFVAASLAMGSLVGEAQDYTYVTNRDHTISITGYSGTNEVVTIPDALDGLPVTSIGDFAFSLVPHAVIQLPPVIIGNPGLLVTNGVFDPDAQPGARPIAHSTGATAKRGLPPMIPISYPALISPFFRRNPVRVTIPDSVTNIGDSAFAECSGLTNVVFGTQVARIGSRAFDLCMRLTDVALPASVTSIGASPFSRCTSLTAITVATNNPSFCSRGGVLFDTLDTLVQYPGGKPGPYTIPDGVVWIGSAAFRGCRGLTQLTLPDSVRAIEYNAFESCSGLTQVQIGSAVGYIGSGAFDDCPRLAAITVDPRNGFYYSQDGVLFDREFAYLVRYPQARAGAYAIPDGVAGVDDLAFLGCTNLTRVTMTDSVTNIGYQAFQACSGLTNALIGSGVADLGDAPFSYCDKLRDIQVDSDNPCYSSLDGVLFDRDRTTLIRYPPAKAGSYIVPEGVTQFGYSAFDNCNRLSDLRLADSVTNIAPYAFASCSRLTHVAIGRGVIHIDPSALEAYSLSNITVAAQNADYDSVDGVLFNKDRTELIKFPAGKAGDYAIPAGVTTIGANAFESAAYLTSVTVPASVTNIGAGAFQCSGRNLQSLFFKGDAPALETDAFFAYFPPMHITGELVRCATIYRLPETEGWPTPPALFGGLSTAWMPFSYLVHNGGVTITGYTGSGGALVIPGKLEGLPVIGIGDHAFANCRNLTSVVVPESVTSIGCGAFQSCAQLRDVSVSSHVTTIRPLTFAYCPRLSRIVFRGNAPAFAPTAFVRDSAATIYYFPNTTGW